MICISIQLPERSTAAPTASSLGTKETVASWSCVADWKMPTSTPTSRAVISVGAASLAVIIMASMPIFMTLASFMSLSRGRWRGERSASWFRQLMETSYEGLDDQRPPADHHEEQDLERERHHHRG